MIRSALIRILQTCDRVLNACWTRLAPTHEEVLGRIDQIADDNFDDGEIEDETPTPSIVTASVIDDSGERVLTDDEDGDDEDEDDVGAIRSRWWMNMMIAVWAKNGCEPTPLAGDEDKLDFSFGAGPPEERS